MSLTSAELKKRIADILKDADLETTSAKKVRIQLEEDLETDLTSRKEEIGRLIQEVMDENADEEEDGEDDVVKQDQHLGQAHLQIFSVRREMLRSRIHFPRDENLL